MPEITPVAPQAPAPPPLAPIGPAADPHSEATAFTRLRELRRSEAPPEDAPAAEAAPTARRAADGKFTKAAEAPPAAEAQDAAPAEAASADTEPQTEAEAAAELATLNDLAEHLGVDVAELYKLRIPVDIDGTKEEVSLGEWKDGYHQVKKLTAEQTKLAAERTKLEAARKAAIELAEQHDNQIKSWVTATAQLVRQKYDGIDWNNLRAADPGQYAALQLQYQQEMGQLNQVAAEHMRSMAERKAAADAEAEQTKATTLQAEHAALRDSIKEWRDQKTYTDESRAVFDYAAKLGWDESTLAGMGSRSGDHRVIAALRKAMLYDAANAKAREAKKPLVKIGTKVLAPAGRTEGSAEARTIKGLISQAAKTGDWRDGLAALRAIRRK